MALGRDAPVSRNLSPLYGERSQVVQGACLWHRRSRVRIPSLAPLVTTLQLAPVAQRIEYWASDPGVVGSNPARRAKPFKPPSDQPEIAHPAVGLSGKLRHRCGRCIYIRQAHVSSSSMGQCSPGWSENFTHPPPPGAWLTFASTPSVAARRRKSTDSPSVNRSISGPRQHMALHSFMQI